MALDSDWIHGTCIKAVLYLDELGRDNGALRVIPGSHRCDDSAWSHVRQASRSAELWGIAGPDLPCVVLDSKPGDLVAFNTNLMHAAFGGGNDRRMIAVQFWSAFHTPAQFAELDKHMRNWSATRALHTELLHRSAPASRLPHLRQISERHITHPHFKDSPEAAFFRTQLPGNARVSVAEAFSETELRTALVAYGIHADSITPLDRRRLTFASVFLARAGSRVVPAARAESAGDG